MCSQWINSFDAFLEHIGMSPEDAVLDRIDNDGNYEPGNVRWTTITVSMNNKRQNGGRPNLTGITGVEPIQMQVTAWRCMNCGHVRIPRSNLDAQPSRCTQCGMSFSGRPVGRPKLLKAGDIVEFTNPEPNSGKLAIGGKELKRPKMEEVRA